MSIIGNNIKKIRTVKKLNQSEFAVLFNLSRASIGSYEEGRADPKIDKIIDIANYFSIKLDLFLKSELSVNQISGFELTDTKMKLGYENNLLEKRDNISKRVIYIDHNSANNFIELCKTDKKWIDSKIILPPTVNKSSSIAFEHNDNAMDINNNGISMSDIVFGEKVEFENVFENYIYIIVLKDSILLRKVLILEETITLIAINVNFQPKVFNKKDVLAFYKINSVIKNSINHFIS